MRGGFNNDNRSAGNKNSLSITTSRTTRSALPPIELDRYYCRRNWYIDINGYHQFHTSYDKIVINNKNKNKNVTTPKQLERVADNNNEEPEGSELNNKDVNNEFEVIITPETTPHREGVLKVRDSPKSNTTSVATKKNTPTGQRETGGGVKNDTSNRKSTASIMTKSNLSAPPLHNNKYGCYYFRFDGQDCSTIPKHVPILEREKKITNTTPRNKEGVSQRGSSESCNDNSTTPSKGIMTPLEDPSHYNCPSTTIRNFSGHWPLATSKLLLDITSHIVPSDIQSGTLNLVKALATIAEKRTSPTPIITVVSGDKDPVVPIEAVRYFVSKMNDTTGTTSAATTIIKSYIDLIEIANGDHGLLAQSVNDTPQLNTNNKTKKRSTTQETLDHVSSFLERCVRIL